jgi:nucleotide-binding universal stress UspA family protein
MYKRLLVPLDGSELAERALPYVEELASKLGSEIILVNVRKPSEDPDNPEHRVYLSKMVATVEQDIKKSPSLPTGEKVKVDSAIIGSSGMLLTHPAEEILNYAETYNISLIIMATHGRTGIKRWALGSTAEKVARASKYPILLVRANTAVPESVRIDRILVPLDGSRQGEVVLPHIEKTARKLKAKIYLLHVLEPPYHIYPVYEGIGYYVGAGIVQVPYSGEELKPLKATAEEYLESISGKLMAKGIKTSYQVKVGSAGEEIIKAEEEMGIDMVAMSTHGHSGVNRWEHGSIADKVLHAGNTPLLLVREPARRQKRKVRETSTGLETIDSLIANLASDDGVLRIKARRSLVAIGKQAVGRVAEALKSRKHWVRWEAAKTLAQIGDPTATRALINALEDDEFDVRWLAAEGLIHIGAKAIEPLLKTLVEHPDSPWLREGTHHVLHDLTETKFRQSVRPVLAALEDVQPSLEVVPAAEAALDIISKSQENLLSQS